MTTAPETFAEQFDLGDRLASVLGWAVADGRLTDDEADYVERSMAGAAVVEAALETRADRIAELLAGQPDDLLARLTHQHGSELLVFWTLGWESGLRSQYTRRHVEDAYHDGRHDGFVHGLNFGRREQADADREGEAA